MTPLLRGLGWIALFPRNVAIVVLRGYQAVISPLYGDVCRYHPTCSHYTLEAIARYGVLAGSVLGVRRLVRCHPWARGGIDDVPVRGSVWTHRTKSGFVAPGMK